MLSHSGKRFSQTNNIQRWTFEVDYRILTAAESRQLWAAIVGAKGKHNTLGFEPPIFNNSAGDIIGTATVSSAKALGATGVNFSGTLGTLSAGDYIKFSNHDKVYLVLSASNGAITIEPPLYKTLSITDTIIYSNVSWTVQLDNDKSDINISSGALGSAQLSLIEVVA